MIDENVKEILTCIIKHIRPDGEFYPFSKDEIKKMNKCLNPEPIKNCLMCKYYDKKKN